MKLTPRMRAMLWDLLAHPRAKTVCALAWDPYNTNGDCLASK